RESPTWALPPCSPYAPFPLWFRPPLGGPWRSAAEAPCDRGFGHQRERDADQEACHVRPPRDRAERGADVGEQQLQRCPEADQQWRRDAHEFEEYAERQ